jgi:murein DD-endopeptidase MepM/ murein hydrolase activator NlpD
MPPRHTALTLTALSLLAALRLRVEAWARVHRGELAALAMVGLAGFGITALAVVPLAALSTLAPDAADLPRVTISQALATPALSPQLQALADHDMELSRSTVSRSADSVEVLLTRLGVSDAEAASFLRRDGTAARVLGGRAGRMLRARTDGAGRLIELSARYPVEEHARRGTHFNRMVVRRNEAGHWGVRVDEVAFDTQVQLAAGSIRTSLFAATDAAEVPDAVAVQLAEIFSADIDFHRELRRGDRFVVVYEALSADGEPVPWNDGAGRVLAAEFVNAGRSQRALWFAAPGDATGSRGGYYSPDGTSRRRAFLASPLEFSRVTSGFTMRRDPINQRWRAHLGVDYAAPAGTAVRAVGDGSVESAGWMNGYGETVTVAHGNGRVTLYAHLSRIDVKKGERVAQGQPLGAVGATGWATGPHLHFEFRVQGAHQDPIAIARQAEVQPLPPRALALFVAERDGALGRLALASSLGEGSQLGPQAGQPIGSQVSSHPSTQLGRQFDLRPQTSEPTSQRASRQVSQQVSQQTGPSTGPR